MSGNTSGNRSGSAHREFFARCAVRRADCERRIARTQAHLARLKRAPADPYANALSLCIELDRAIDRLIGEFARTAAAPPAPARERAA